MQATGIALKEFADGAHKLHGPANEDTTTIMLEAQAAMSNHTNPKTLLTHGTAPALHRSLKYGFGFGNLLRGICRP